MALLKKINTTQIGKMVHEHEKKHPKCMYYLTDYNKTTKKIKGEKMSMSDFIKRLKKDVDTKDFIKQCKSMAKQAKGKKGAQQGGWRITAKFFVMMTNITMAFSTIYIVCVGSAAQTSIVAGFVALASGKCNSFAEGAFRYLGLGNPVCNAYSSALANVLLAITGNPAAIAKITGIIVIIMKAPYWIPRLHCAFMKKLANVFVLGGVMDESELELIEEIYQGYLTSVGNMSVTGPSSQSSGPSFEILDNE